MKFVILLAIFASVLQLTTQNQFGQKPYGSNWGAAGHGWAGSQVDNFRPQTRSIWTRNDDAVFQSENSATGAASARAEAEDETDSSSSSSSEETGEVKAPRKIKATPYVLQTRHRRKLSYPPELHVKRVWTPRARLQTRSGGAYPQRVREYGVAGTLWDHYRPPRVYIRGDESALFEDDNRRAAEEETYAGPLRIYRRVDVRPLTPFELRSLDLDQTQYSVYRQARPETRSLNQNRRRRTYSTAQRERGLELPPRLELKSGDDVYFGDGINWSIYRTDTGFTRIGTRDGEVVVRVVRPFGQDESFTTI